MRSLLVDILTPIYEIFISFIKDKLLLMRIKIAKRILPPELSIGIRRTEGYGPVITMSKRKDHVYSINGKTSS